MSRRFSFRCFVLTAAALQFWLAAWICQANPLPGTVAASAPPVKITFPDLYEASIAELQDGLEKGHFTSVDLIKVSGCDLEKINSIR